MAYITAVQVQDKTYSLNRTMLLLDSVPSNYTVRFQQYLFFASKAYFYRETLTGAKWLVWDESKVNNTYYHVGVAIANDPTIGASITTTYSAQYVAMLFDEYQSS